MKDHLINFFGGIGGSVVLVIAFIGFIALVAYCIIEFRKLRKRGREIDKEIKILEQDLDRGDYQYRRRW